MTRDAIISARMWFAAFTLVALGWAGVIWLARGMFA